MLRLPTMLAAGLLFAGASESTMAADPPIGVVPEPPIVVPPLQTGAVMFVPTTNWASRYKQTYIVQQPVLGTDVYEYDDIQTAPSAIIVVPPTDR